MKKRICSFVLFVSIAAAPFSVLGHSGRTDSNGGHYDRSNGTYHYHNGGSSSSSSSSTSKTPKVAIPKNIRCIVTSNTIIISWDPVAGATGYVVSVSGDVRETTETRITYDGLFPEQKYDYAVRAKQGTTFGDYSFVSSVTTLPQPVLVQLDTTVAEPPTKDEAKPEKTIKVRVDGDFVDFEDQNPVILNGRVLIPVRSVLEKMGYLVSWDPDTKVLQIVKDPSLKATVANKTDDNIAVFVDGTLVDFEDQAPVLFNGRLLVPIRFMVEKVGYTVEWDSAEYIVDIIK